MFMIGEAILSRGRVEKAQEYWWICRAFFGARSAKSARKA
jgi:hypothetical protein